MSHNLALPLHRHAVATPDAPALSVDGHRLTYGALARRASELAAVVAATSSPLPPRVAILGSRSLEAIVGMLGTCWAAGAYVPFDPTAPEERIVALLRILSPDALVADARGAASLTPRVLAACPGVVVVPDAGTAEALGGGPALVAMDDLPPGPGGEPVHLGPDELAYVIFTSGTTGIPKGVMVPAGAVSSYLAALRDRFGIGPGDRCGEAIDMTFDLSVSNMFGAWDGGACLHVKPVQGASVAEFIRAEGITYWLGVPSGVHFMRRMGHLAPGSLPSLRASQFCGEPLAADVAAAWRAAAPGVDLVNLYGPTEATVGCTWQDVRDPVPVTEGRGVVAIGRPLPGMEAAVLGPDGRDVADGGIGELAVSGAQLALGYLGDEGLTERRFPRRAGKRWYLTGDLARRDADGTLHHLGRMDNQVKVNGFRVELEEVDAHLRRAAGSAMGATVAYPVRNGVPTGLTCLVAGTDRDGESIREALRGHVPHYLVPDAVHVVEEMPLTPNGKIDRKAVLAIVEGIRKEGRGRRAVPPAPVVAGARSGRAKGRGVAAR